MAFVRAASAHDALAAVRDGIQNGLRVALDADLSSYFDTIPHDKLMHCLERRIADRSVLALIRKWLKCPIVESDGHGGDKTTKPKQGTPQGGVISPLLANIFLHELDRQFYGWRGPAKAVKAKLVRYADDFVILAYDVGARMTNYVNQVLDRLGLSLNRDKTRIVDLRQEGERLDFLGFTFRFDRNQLGPGKVSEYSPFGQVDESSPGKAAPDDPEAGPTAAGETHHQDEPLSPWLAELL